MSGYKLWDDDFEIRDVFNDPVLIAPSHNRINLTIVQYDHRSGQTTRSAEALFSTESARGPVLDARRGYLSQ